MGFLETADARLFELLNHWLVNPAADDLMLFLTRAGQSGHIFLLAALFMVVRRGWPGVVIVLLAAMAVGLADFTASGILKPLVQRVRPCFALEGVRLLVDQSHSWSFASSHAANTAALASAVWIFFHRGPLVERLFVATMISHALLVGFSRIHVGVHYPGDVLAGMAIGVASASLVWIGASWLYKNFIQPRLTSDNGASVG